jgi:glycosyltransferase involved in cell wall biosynthesis
MSAFYAIPSKLLLKKPLLANLIANAKRDYKTLSLSHFFYNVDFKFADVILGNSNAGFKAYGLENNPKKKLIYNGVRLERFDIQIDKEVIKKQLDITTPFIVVMVASASKNKDYDLLLEVAKQMDNNQTDITFIGIGDGSELNRLKSRIENEKIKNILLTGRRNDVESLIKISDIALLLTPSEGISNAIIEYMAMGKPVITTDLVGGSCEIIEVGKSGYIMQPNAHQIANKINELLNNPKQMIALGQKGKQIIEQKFSIERMGQEYVEIYEKTFNNEK